VSERRNLYRELRGKSRNDDYGRSSIRNALDSLWNTTHSKYKPRVLGYSTDPKDKKALEVLEEQRTHTHVMSGTQQGKSKFLEKNMQLDIDRLVRNDPGACGFTFLDPTDSGATAYNVLKYCIEKNFNRVILIDPYHYWHFDKVIAITPFGNKDSNKQADINSVNNTLQITSEIKDPAQTKRIQRYLRALLSVLYDAGCTLSDVEYFTDFDNRVYAMKRHEILSKIDPLDRHRIILEWAFKNLKNYWDFESTVRRVEDLLDEPLRSMFSHKHGIDYVDLIRDKWVVLVNLDADGPLELIQTRLLATAIINELLSALHRMRKTRNWSKPYYLYIDEAADYATRKLARVLSHKGKTGLKVYLAHQSMSQFEDRLILHQVMTNCATKVMLDLSGPDDRAAMVKALGYGGDITDREAAFANADLPKQVMVYKEPKKKPARYRVVDCITPQIPYPKEEAFIKRILKQEWYYPVVKEPSPVDIQTNQTYEPPRRSHQTSKKTPKAAHRPNSKVTAPPGSDKNPFRRLRKDEAAHPTDAEKQ
jgi:TraM recognition site of TraD and TraG